MRKFSDKCKYPGFRPFRMSRLNAMQKPTP
jgi:hypothetical protein